jgi:esterase/lipase superfamily enzyme
MRREQHALWSPAIGASGDVIVYGDYGKPVVAFPSEWGQVGEWEDRGMVEAIAPLLDGGQVKLYTVAGYNAESWANQGLPLEERARAHLRYESWMLDQLVPFIWDDCQGRQDIILTGASMGAFHAANFALRRADLFPRALCLSGVYDIARMGWGDRGDTVYFNNPMDYVGNLHGDHLDWLRGRVRLVLVVGQGMWEDTTGALESTRRFAALLGEKGIDHVADYWGHDVPHDWQSWRAQLAHHLPQC